MAELAIVRSPSGVRFTVARQHAERFQRFLADLEGSGYRIIQGQSGGYNYRNIAGTNTLSQHAFGNAIDINWQLNARGSQGNIPVETARELAARHGLRWGGDWRNPDPMHFEVVRDAESPPVQQRSITAFAGSQPTPQRSAGPAITGRPAPLSISVRQPSPRRSRRRRPILLDLLGLRGGRAQGAQSSPDRRPGQAGAFPALVQLGEGRRGMTFSEGVDFANRQLTNPISTLLPPRRPGRSGSSPAPPRPAPDPLTQPMPLPPERRQPALDLLTQAMPLAPERPEPAGMMRLGGPAQSEESRAGDLAFEIANDPALELAQDQTRGLAAPGRSNPAFPPARPPTQQEQPQTQNGATGRLQERFFQPSQPSLRANGKGTTQVIPRPATGQHNVLDRMLRSMGADPEFRPPERPTELLMRVIRGEPGAQEELDRSVASAMPFFGMARPAFWTQARLAIVREMRAAGRSVEEIAQHFDVTPTAVTRAIERRGDEAGIPRVTGEQRFIWQNPERRAEFARLWRKRMPVAEIARQMNLTPDQVQNAARRLRRELNLETRNWAGGGTGRIPRGAPRRSRNRQEALRLHEEGMSIPQIAERLGISRQAVHFWFKKEGIPTSLAPRISEQRDRIVRMYQEGLSVREIAERSGITSRGIYLALHARNVELRPSRGPVWQQPEAIRLVAELVRRGAPAPHRTAIFIAIGRRFGVSHQIIRRMAVEFGLQLYERGRYPRPQRQRTPERLERRAERADTEIGHRALSLEAHMLKLEESLKKQGLSSDEIAAQINKLHGTEITGRDIQEGNVWWRLQELSDTEFGRGGVEFDPRTMGSRHDPFDDIDDIDDIMD